MMRKSGTERIDVQFSNCSVPGIIDLLQELVADGYISLGINVVQNSQ